jgi:hypothetical protein
MRVEKKKVRGEALHVMWSRQGQGSANEIARIQIDKN